jgi:hypothetical protein
MGVHRTSNENMVILGKRETDSSMQSKVIMKSVKSPKILCIFSRIPLLSSLTLNFTACALKIVEFFHLFTGIDAQ